MNYPFDLPSGLVWREPDPSLRSWWGSNKCPFEQCAQLELTVIIRHPDGRERTYVTYAGLIDPVKESRDSGESLLRSIEFLWSSDGNCGCDCNRSKFFARAGGEPEPTVECTNVATYKIVSPDWLADAEAE